MNVAQPETTSPPHRLGRYQFSLRSLLLFVFAVSLALSYAVMAVREWRQRKQLDYRAELEKVQREAEIEKWVNSLAIPSEAMFLDLRSMRRTCKARVEAMERHGTKEFVPARDLAEAARHGYPDSASRKLPPKEDGTGWSSMMDGSIEWNAVLNAETTAQEIVLAFEYNYNSALGPYFKEHPEEFNNRIRPSLFRLLKSYEPRLRLAACKALLASGNRSEEVRRTLQEITTAEDWWNWIGMSWSEDSADLMKKYGWTPPPFASRPPLQFPAYEDSRKRSASPAETLPAGVLARIGATRFQPGGYVRSMAFSPDGKRLATVGFNGLQLWDSETGNRTACFAGVDSWGETALAFSPDGKHLAVAMGRVDTGVGPQGAIRVWDLAQGRIAWTSETLPSEIPAIAYSPGSDLLASAGNDVRLWHAATGRQMAVLPDDKPFVGDGSKYVAFSPDGKFVAALTSLPSGTRVWEVATRKKLPDMEPSPRNLDFGQTAFPGPAGRFVFSADSKSIVGKCGELGVGAWDVTSGRLLQKHPYRLGSMGGCFALASNGKSYLCWGYLQPVRRLDIVDLAQAGEPLKFDEHMFGNVAISPDGKRAAYFSGSIELWDLESSRKLTPSEFPKRVLGTAPDGKVLYSLCDKSIMAWDPAAGKKLKELPAPAGRKFLRAALSDDAALLAAVDDGHNLSLWDMEHWTFLRNIAVPAQVPTQCDLPERALLAFRPGSQWLAVALEDGTIATWDCQTDRLLYRFWAKTAGCVTFSRDGSHLAVGGTENPLGVWQCDAGMKSIVLAQDVSYSATALSSKGERLAGSEDGMLAIWDVKTRKQLHAARFKDRVAHLMYSPDDQILLSATPDDSSIDLWDAGTGKPVGRLDGHRGAVTSLLFSRDGKRLLSSSDDTTILVWDWESIREWCRKRASLP